MGCLSCNVSWGGYKRVSCYALLGEAGKELSDRHPAEADSVERFACRLCVIPDSHYATLGASIFISDLVGQ
jgi:hypothetical protein